MDALVEYAGHEFHLSSRQKDGATLRAHLNVAWRATGQMPEELQPKELPECLFYLWQWFCELSNGRQSGGFGPEPLSYSEIKAWAELTGNIPEAWEVETIKELDRVFLKEISKDA